jgi:serine/threonine-protein kinase
MSDTSNNITVGSEHNLGDVIAERYELIEEIGRGGYAVVYRSHDREADRELAVKTLLPVSQRPRESLARFRREADLVARLRHDNTVRIFGYGMEDDVYIAMELLEGRPLSSELDQENCLSVSRSVVICCEVLKSLSEAHELGIIHRDLKPENIYLVDNDDGTESIKVLDFGIAKLTKEAAFFDPVSLTMQGKAMGTPNYMSPEQAKGQDLTPHSDIYACGLLLFEMITGKPPYHGGGAMDIMLRHVNAPIPKLPDPDLRNTPIERTIRKALQKDYANRFQSASDMLAALGGQAAVPVGEMHKAQRLHPSSQVPPENTEKSRRVLSDTYVNNTGRDGHRFQNRPAVLIGLASGIILLVLLYFMR